MQWCASVGLACGRSGGDEEMKYRRHGGGERCAEDFFLFAVEGTEVEVGLGEGGEERDGFLGGVS